MVAVWCALEGCVDDARPPSVTSPTDATVLDVGPLADRYIVPDIPPVDPCRAGPCGAVDLCGAPAGDGGLGSGNGLDDNCNGQVDEGCPCAPGEMRSCFPGAADRRGIGVCRDGMMRCTELGAWVGNECTGATPARDETCDGRDEDCDGSIDDGLMGCANTLRCPASAGVAPLQAYTLDGRTIDPSARSYRWTITCPDGVSPCPAPTDPTDPTLRIMPVRSGLYTVTLALERAAGRSDTCRFPLYVQGRGLRVELDWDRKGGIASSGVDLDLHVAPMDRRAAASYRWFTTSDCYFATCKAPGGTVVWSTGPTDTRFAPAGTAEACQNAPPPFGDLWRTSGRCWNPRLDTDDITCDPRVTDTSDPAFCFPENAAIDDPPDEVTFRLMVNFYRDHGTCTDADLTNDVVQPVLSVYCGGLARAAVGSVEDGLVSMRCRDNPGIGSVNWSWLAADVRVLTNACGVRDCRVTPLRDRGKYPRCGEEGDGDVCRDERGRVFVRRAVERPVETEFAESP